MIILWRSSRYLRQAWAYGLGTIRAWTQSASVGPVSPQLTNLIAASSRIVSLIASTPDQRTTATEDDTVATDALSQSVEAAAQTDQIWEFTMDPAPYDGATYGISGWSIEVRIARNIGDTALLTVAGSIITVGDASTPSVFRASFATSSLSGYDGIYRWQAFRTDTGSRDLLAGTRLTAIPIILP